MALTWYNFFLDKGGGNTYTGYFNVDASGKVQGYYDGDNFTTSRLKGAETTFIYGDIYTFTGGNNQFNITDTLFITYFHESNADTTIIQSDNLQTFLGTDTNIFALDNNLSFVSSPYNVNVYPNVIIKLNNDPSCFNEGTQILCGILNNESANPKYIDKYIPIENLRKGDIVKTYLHGYKKIVMIGKNTMINNPESRFGCMYVMKKTDTNSLTDDLIITGGHSVLVDDLGIYKKRNERIMKNKMIDGKYLLLASVSGDFVKIQESHPFTYYHFVLESDDPKRHFGIWANGVLTETTSRKDFIAHKYIPLK